MAVGFWRVCSPAARVNTGKRKRERRNTSWRSWWGWGWTEVAAPRSRGSGGRPGRRSVTIPATGSLAMGKVVEDHKGAERHLCMSLVGAGYGRSRGAAWSNSSGKVRPRFPRTPVRWAAGAGLRSYSGSRGTELEAWLEWRMAGGGGSTASCSRWR